MLSWWWSFSFWMVRSVVWSWLEITLSLVVRRQLFGEQSFLRTSLVDHASQAFRVQLEYTSPRTRQCQGILHQLWSESCHVPPWPRFFLSRTRRHQRTLSWTSLSTFACPGNCWYIRRVFYLLGHLCLECRQLSLLWDLWCSFSAFRPLLLNPWVLGVVLVLACLTHNTFPRPQQCNQMPREPPSTRLLCLSKWTRFDSSGFRFHLLTRWCVLAADWYAPTFRSIVPESELVAS